MDQDNKFFVVELILASYLASKGHQYQLDTGRRDKTLFIFDREEVLDDFNNV